MEASSIYFDPIENGLRPLVFSRCLGSPQWPPLDTDFVNDQGSCIPFLSLSVHYSLASSSSAASSDCVRIIFIHEVAAVSRTGIVISFDSASHPLAFSSGCTSAFAEIEHVVIDSKGRANASEVLLLSLLTEGNVAWIH
jgi:hypothetical protein